LLVLEQKQLLFSFKRVYCADYPFDVDGCDIVQFIYCHCTDEVEGFTRHKQLTAITDLTMDLETIWGKMDRTWQKHIRQANKANIKIEINQNYDEFYMMYKRFREKKGFDSLLNTQKPSIEIMKNQGTLFTAKMENELLIGILYLEDTNHMTGWVQGSKRLESDQDKVKLISRANRLIDWEAIKYAKAKGMKKYNWGGLWTDEDIAKDKSKEITNRFKLDAGGEPLVCSTYTKVYSPLYKFGHNVVGMVRKMGNAGVSEHMRHDFPKTAGKSQ
jgi:hypothetical protein